MKSSDRIHILAAGTSMNAGFTGKNLIEKFAGIPVEVHIASEFAYHIPLLSQKPFFIMLSQSDETADLRACLMKLKEKNLPVLTITNVKTSTLAREATYFLVIFAGPEISVASTQAYIAQIAILSILLYALSDQTFNLKLELAQVAISIDFAVMEKSKKIK